MTGVWVPCLHVYYPCCLQFRPLLTSSLQNLLAQGSNLSLVIVYSLLTSGTEVCLTAQFLRTDDRHVNAQEAYEEVARVAVDTGKRCCRPTGCGPIPPLTLESPNPPVTLLPYQVAGLAFLHDFLSSCRPAETIFPASTSKKKNEN